VFLTNDHKSFAEAKKLGIQTMSVLDFVNEKCKEYPDLQDFLGINVSKMEIEGDNKANLYDEHLSWDQI